MNNNKHIKSIIISIRKIALDIYFKRCSNSCYTNPFNSFKWHLRPPLKIEFLHSWCITNLPKPIRSKHHPLHLKLWWYYRDDAHVIHSNGPEDLNNLQNSMNQMHPTLKFTHETSKKPNQLSWLNYFQKKTLPWNRHTLHKTV